MKYELIDVYDIFSLSDKMFCTLKALYIYIYIYIYIFYYWLLCALVIIDILS